MFQAPCQANAGTESHLVSYEDEMTYGTEPLPSVLRDTEALTNTAYTVIWSMQ